MTKFQVGLLMGFFLGAVSMFVVLGIIGLYRAEREQKRVMARKEATKEKMPGTAVVPSHTDYAYLDHQPGSALKRPQADDNKEKVVICPLLIRTE